VDTNWHYLGNASYNTGRNNWKYGYEFRRTFVNGYFDNGYRGRLLFPDLANFLAGLPSGNLTSSNHQATGNSRRGTFQNNHAFYMQDSIKLSRRLNQCRPALGLLRCDWRGTRPVQHLRLRYKLPRDR
jgi:hypothetical protein